ncbi:ABC transporter permease [Pseudomonas asiatica]|uniref:ABC transporter permease n=1 Tax=Pseudomonas asiatica TaxID=2219225 RepID=UPI00383AB83E
MALTLFRRVLQSLFVILAMTVIVFAGINLIGNPVDILINPDANAMERARAMAVLGLDKPLVVQYWHFLTGVLQGDLGVSFVYHQPALELIMQRLPATIELAVLALLLAVVIGIPLGLYAGLNEGTWLSRTIMAGSILGFSLPTFWVGLILIMVFSVQLGWLPTNGRGETVEVFGIGWSFLTMDGLKHMLLPAINLSLFKISLVLRLTRAGVQEVLPQDYIKFARAKGLTSGRIIRVHVLKNIMIPVVTVIGLEFGSLIAFSVVTESIYAWPGMGKLIIDSINVLDRPVIVAYLVLMVIIFILLNLIIDVCYTLLDPRVRIDSKG